MGPDPEPVNNIFENPIRDAAIHFGAYLQLKGLLTGGDGTYGNIDRDQLIDEFSNYYQPKYHTYLLRPDLLRTLLKYHVSRRHRRNGSRASAIRINKHPNPGQVKAPGSKPRVRLYVDQARVLRNKFVRSDVVNETQCRLCKITFFNEESKLEHIDSDIHKFRLQYREKRSTFTHEVGGASIGVVGQDNSRDVILRCNESQNLVVKVTMNTSYSTTDIHKIMELADHNARVDATPVKFNDDVPIEVNVTARFSDPGAYIYPLVAKVMPTRLCLLKDLIFRVESELMDQLAPVSPFIQRQDVVREMEGAVLPGEELPKAVFKLQIKTRLGEHKTPGVYTKLLLHKLEEFENITTQEKDSLSRILKLLCGQMVYKEALKIVSQTKAPYILPLTASNYSDRFALLVDFEELQQQREVKNYDRSNEILHRTSKRFLLKVPDLSEGRPSVNKGDKVHVRLHNNDSVTYEGVIHELQAEGLLLGFHREFTKEYTTLESRGIKPRVDVRFTVNRFPILNIHRALSLMNKHNAQSIVFPHRRGSYHPPTRAMPLRPWVNNLIEGNPEQQEAIKKIISKSSGSAPYLVFGPPGTGKTVTLVETIVQVWHANQTQAVKQLVCAPSNAACNNIAQRLINTLPRTAKILRLFSLSTEVINVPQILLSHSNYDHKSQCIIMPTMDQIMEHHIIIVTIVTSGRLVSGGAGGQFQFVYIDECGQASEPEALIAIAGLLTSKNCPSMGQLVLSGDPQQLGPILSSQLAKDFGLGMSLLERLMTHNSLYMRAPGEEYDSSYLTKLVQNFRSHPAILQIPNEMFYDNELKVKGNSEIINKAVGWQELPNPNFPLIFHGVQGVDERESNSPSYFNRQEIDRVIMYMKILFEKGLPNNYKVKPDDVGVISPYRKQVQKIRKAFELLGWEDIRIGSVEEFQGSEKLIIFISTVRSSIALVEEDYRFKLGFLKNPKRFNVSVTRAQALLIVVGNPNILRHDKCWHNLLNYCRDNQAAVGIPFPENDPPDHEQEHVSG